MAIQKHLKNQKHGLLHCVRNDAISTCSDVPQGERIHRFASPTKPKSPFAPISSGFLFVLSISKTPPALSPSNHLRVASVP